MTKRDIPNSLKKMQEEKRMSTINKVQEVIDEIKSGGGIVTKKQLIELTGLSNATFSKDYIKEVLKENRVCQYKDSKVIENREEKSNISKSEISKMEKMIFKLNEQVLKKDIRINEIEEKYEELNENYKRALGKIHQMTKKLEAKGIN